MSQNYKADRRIISFPQMGNIAIPVCAMLGAMGAEVLLPPPNNKQALSLGARYSPETMCLPYKMNLGNYIQALDRGANVLLMFQSPGSCRLGHYTRMAEAKLQELGYDFEMVVFDFYKGKFFEMAKKFAVAAGRTNVPGAIVGMALCIAKFQALDTIERKLFYYRPREAHRGSAEYIYRHGRDEIDRAKSVSEIHKAVNATIKRFEKIKTATNGNIIKISLTGEFFILLDPFSNLEIERELGHLGVEVQREVMLSDWINVKLVPYCFHGIEGHTERAKRTSKHYMTRVVGGDCIESIGDAVHAAQSNLDGVIHIGPFNCNPETVSQSILPHVSRKENIPVMSLMVDEMTGKTGFVTRLEAFVDLVRRMTCGAVGV